jgi:hypothetical protein
MLKSRPLTRLAHSRWHFRLQFVADLGVLATQALGRAGLQVREVVRALLVLTSWTAIAATALVLLLRR